MVAAGVSIVGGISGMMGGGSSGGSGGSGGPADPFAQYRGQYGSQLGTFMQGHARLGPDGQPLRGPDGQPIMEGGFQPGQGIPEGGVGLGELGASAADPGNAPTFDAAKLTNDARYQWMLRQGGDATQAMRNATGGGVSGGMDAELQQQRLGLAGQFMDTMHNEDLNSYAANLQHYRDLNSNRNNVFQLGLQRQGQSYTQRMASQNAQNTQGMNYAQMLGQFAGATGFNGGPSVQGQQNQFAQGQTNLGNITGGLGLLRNANDRSNRADWENWLSYGG